MDVLRTRNLSSRSLRSPELSLGSTLLSMASMENSENSFGSMLSASTANNSKSSRRVRFYQSPGLTDHLSPMIPKTQSKSVTQIDSTPSRLESALSERNKLVSKVYGYAQQKKNLMRQCSTPVKQPREIRIKEKRPSGSFLQTSQNLRFSQSQDCSQNSSQKSFDSSRELKTASLVLQRLDVEEAQKSVRAGGNSVDGSAKDSKGVQTDPPNDSVSAPVKSSQTLSDTQLYSKSFSVTFLEKNVLDFSLDDDSSRRSERLRAKGHRHSNAFFSCLCLMLHNLHELDVSSCGDDLLECKCILHALRATRLLCLVKSRHSLRKKQIIAAQKLFRTVGGCSIHSKLSQLPKDCRNVQYSELFSQLGAQEFQKMMSWISNARTELKTTLKQQHARIEELVD